MFYIIIYIIYGLARRLSKEGWEEKISRPMWLLDTLGPLIESRLFAVPALWKDQKRSNHNQITHLKQAAQNMTWKSCLLVHPLLEPHAPFGFGAQMYSRSLHNSNHNITSQRWDEMRVNACCKDRESVKLKERLPSVTRIEKSVFSRPGQISDRFQ